MTENPNRLTKLFQRLSRAPSFDPGTNRVTQVGADILPPSIALEIADEAVFDDEAQPIAPLPHPVGTIENGVLIGEGGTLFLAGGAHAVLDIVTGQRPITEQSCAVFAENIKARAAWAADNDATYLHVIFPDKQSIIPESWPLGTPLQLGELYIERCQDKGLPLRAVQR